MDADYQSAIDSTSSRLHGCQLASAFHIIRTVMRGLLLPGQRKLHWRDESDKRRQQIVEAVATVGLEYIVVVVRQGRKGERPERRRRHRLERLLFELDQRGVEHVVLESRGAKDDQRDRELLTVLHPRGILKAKGLHIDHAYGRTEALLWLPDAVCGAVTRSRLGEPAFIEKIESRSKIIMIEIDY